MTREYEQKSSRANVLLKYGGLQGNKYFPGIELYAEMVGEIIVLQKIWKRKTKIGPLAEKVINETYTNKRVLRALPNILKIVVTPRKSNKSINSPGVNINFLKKIKI